MTETNSTDQPAECPDACTEHHTYGPDCAATTADYDPNADMRDRYARALAGWAGSKAFNPANSGTEWEHARSSWYGYADAALAARDVYLTNVRRISKQQTTQLAELYMTTKKRAEQAEAKLASLHEGEEPDPDPLAEPTPAQWLWRWNRATPEQRLDMAGRILQAFETASGCFLLNHKTEAPRRKAAEQALGRVHAALDRWALNTVMPQTVRALDDIRRALEPPKEQP